MAAASILTTDDLLKEKKRLEAIIAEALTARVRIALLNKLIALNDDDPLPTITKEPKSTFVSGDKKIKCDKPGCEDWAGTDTKQGLAVHNYRKHSPNGAHSTKKVS